MTWPVSTDPQDSDALKWFLEKVPVVKEVWDSMSQEARRKAFTAAGVAHADILTQVHAAIAKAIKEGTGLAQFKKDVRAKLLSAWGEQVANPAWRIETIFRTNVQSAYASGRWKQLNHPTIRKVRPYMVFDAVMDNRVSHICEKLDGTVLPTEEWEKRGLIPPLHFNCRSALRSLRKSQALKQEKFGQEPPDVQAQDGFGQPLDEWKPDLGKYPPGIQEELDKKQVQKLVEDIVGGIAKPTPADAEVIRNRVARAKFTERQVKVEYGLRGAEYEGTRLGRKADSLVYHVVKRIERNEWPVGTTIATYLADIKRHAEQPNTRVGLFWHKKRLMVAIMATNMLPTAYGVDLLPWLFIFYSVVEGRIVSCYPAKHEKHADIHGDAIWLK